MCWGKADAMQLGFQSSYGVIQGLAFRLSLTNCLNIMANNRQHTMYRLYAFMIQRYFYFCQTTIFRNIVNADGSWSI